MMSEWSAGGAAANFKNENMAEQFKAAGNTADKPVIGSDGAINTKDGLNINPNLNSLHRAMVQPLKAV